ncbi:MAG: hypothetical protein ACE5QW_01230 [Thermoplasmata archaeon]
MDPKEAIRVYQFAERLKSELIIANNLIQETSLMKDEVSGGKRILLAYMNAVLGEANLAVNAAQSPLFESIAQKIGLAVEKIGHSDFSDASKVTTEALTFSTSAAGKAAQILNENDLF